MTMTLTQLLDTPTTEEITATILSDLASQNPALPTTSWQAGSVPKTMVGVFADSESNLYEGRYNVASGGYLGLATGDWLTLLAAQNYGVERTDAVSTQGLVQFTDAGGGPHAITSGSTTVASGTRRYVASASSTLPLNKSIFVPVRASTTGLSGNVGNGAITTLVTALVGVTVSNVVPWISRIGTASVATRGWVKLTSTAGGSFAAGACTVSDGAGQLYTNVQATTLAATTQTEVLFEAVAVGTAYNVGNGLITTDTVDPLGDITCVNSAPSVNVTSWITTAGSEQQTDASVTTESRNVLLARGIDWIRAGIELLTTETVLSSGTVITRVKVVSNPSGVAGKIGVWAASSAGAILAGDVAEIQASLDDQRSLCATVQVQSASNLTVNIVGTVTVPAAYLATAQSAANTNLAGLAASTPIGGNTDTANTLQLEDIIAAIKNATYDSSGVNTNPASPLTIAISQPAADVSLAVDQVPIFSVALTWTGV